MSYANKEVQREYQRAWISNKKAKLESLNPTKNLTAVATNDIVTWDQLQDVRKVYKQVQTWNECLELAEGLQSKGKWDRLKLAELALQACVIQQGGDRKTERYLKGDYGRTLSAFASKLKINKRTMSKWVQIYFLIQLLPKDTPINFATADLASREIGMKAIRNFGPALFLETYHTMLYSENGSREWWYIKRTAMSSYGMMRKHRALHWSDKMCEGFEKELEELNETWKVIKKERDAQNAG